MSPGSLRGSFTTYGIVDPRTFRFVYVGKTLDFAERMRAHLGVAPSKGEAGKQPAAGLRSWLHQAVEAGISPCFVVLEVVQTWRDLLRSEGEWIRRLSPDHHLLLSSWSEHNEPQNNVSSRSAEAPYGREAVEPQPASTPAQDNVDQRALRPKPPNQGLSWTKALDQELTQHFRAGSGARSIATSMGRSPSSIRARLVRLELLLERKDLKD